MLRLLTCIGLVAVALLNSSAQDPVTLDSHIVKVEYEDARIRVMRLHYEPHQQLPMHHHTSRAGVYLTPGTFVVTLPDGSTRSALVASGQWFWTEPLRHSVMNSSDHPMDVVEIELKNAKDPAISVQATPPNVLNEPVPIQTEPFHRPVYQNQYVRILDVSFQPGQTTLLHTHGHDYVAVHLSVASVQSQLEGKDWSPVPVHFGEVQMNLLHGKPYTHRVRNVGTTPFHVMVFELLQ